MDNESPKYKELYEQLAQSNPVCPAEPFHVQAQRLTFFFSLKLYRNRETMRLLISPQGLLSCIHPKHELEKFDEAVKVMVGYVLTEYQKNHTD